jgi:arylsulfatase A-like enzyme
MRAKTMLPMIAAAAAAVAELAAAGSAAAAAAAAARPHILMMLADGASLSLSRAPGSNPRARCQLTLRALFRPDWGSYDASWRMKELGREPDIHTKNIDALSADGIRFANYYVQPICTPTRSVLMSGRYSIHTGCEHILFGADEPSCLPTELPIMPQAFKQLGYQTHMAGKVSSDAHPLTRSLRACSTAEG